MDFHTSTPPMEVGTWSEETIPWSDDVKEVVQATTQIRAIYRHNLLARAARPIRRRVRPEDPRIKSHRTFTMSSIPAIELRGGLDSSELSSCSSPVTIVTTATSSAGTPWSTTGRVEEIFEDDDDYNLEGAGHYHQDEDVVVPKIEPIDELDMDDVYEVNTTPMPFVNTPPADTSPVGVPVKRPRGRPRKYPKPDPEAMAKVHKGRSKTGCGTCRRRKKKCDEAKPICMNCDKNGLECEGYRQLQQWKSGKERKLEEERRKKLEAEEAKRRDAMSEVPSFPLPHLFLGVETEGDRIFFKHYTDRLSLIFTVEGETESAFRKIVLPVAQNDKGLMHSILSLASKHIDYTSPYGRQLLLEHPNVNVQELEARSKFHHDEAIEELVRRKHDESVSATYLQIVCLVLQTLSDPHPSGQHRLHLKYSQQLPPSNEDPELSRFLDEFFRYHIYADQLICLPQPGHPFNNFQNEWNLPNTVLQRDAVPLLGVADGLFLYMSRITNIRNQIRENLLSDNDPAVDYRVLYEATEIYAGIKEWTPVWQEGDHREVAGKLYKHMMCVYLFRTIYPPRTSDWKPDSRIIEAVNQGIIYLGLIDPKSKLQTVLLAPAFVIGCAAFKPEQRQKIREAIAVVKAYMEYRNTDTALKVLEEVWRLMDRRDERSWDWQSIAHRMNMDFLAT